MHNSFMLEQNNDDENNKSIRREKLEFKTS
jgi:hypothetical protein